MKKYYFDSVDPKVDFVSLEKKLLNQWYGKGIVKKYLQRNKNSKKRFSFLDGPITANNPMGVHHAWGRTYKDLWQRYKNMRGFRERFQNGFDCQGLWVEVEVEKELGFKNKKEIESYGIANFVDKCKERVYKYAAIQTEQSKRLGYFMDWDSSYFTMSEENNYAIWNFLKVCWERGWLYKGKDSVPWCPRCQTAISQHEILTEDYKEVTHESLYLKLPLVGKNQSLLVWTTTPWTIPANIAVAVDEALDYALVDGNWVAKNSVERIFGSNAEITKKLKGSQLIGLEYKGPYDNLPGVREISDNPKFHKVVATDRLILPISTDEGTGLVHTAVSAGEEDFKLGKKLRLPMIPVISDNAEYLPGLGELTGQNAKKNPRIILDYLENNGWVFRIENYTHRYPVCWRCKTELVWKVADEWYVAMDRLDPTHSKELTLRRQMIGVAKKIKWLPSFGLGRELDWLANMHDWLISKKNRYWGLALPIYECSQCGHFEVIGSKEELKSRAVDGWDKFDGNSPHRPWIDEVKIKCVKCSEKVNRILDVGNPWLDAGVVSFSTAPSEWFPADFITESFPGQFKNWFYSLIAMSAVLSRVNPTKAILGFALACGMDGQIMHKSNPKTYISFDDGADKAGVDVMRWMFVTQNPAQNLLFGYELADETRRRFHLKLWNIYNFFVTYANLARWHPKTQNSKFKIQNLSILDIWIATRLNQTIKLVTESLDNYDAYAASNEVEKLVDDLSNWYVRRSRDKDDKEVLFSTLYLLLTTISKLLAPSTPFISEAIYKNLTKEDSVHLSNWPVYSLEPTGYKLVNEMEEIRKICQMGHATRKEKGIKVRQPLNKFKIQNSKFKIDEYEFLIRDELNIKEIEYKLGKGELSVEFDTVVTPELIAEGEAREIVRQIQEERKKRGTRLDEKVNVSLPNWPREFEEYIKREALVAKIQEGSFEVNRI